MAITMATKTIKILLFFDLREDTSLSNIPDHISNPYLLLLNLKNYL
jgi:hypothetical protein